ncbi:STAS domain-containing protein [Streptomyces sp. MMBL 11-3]|uniref:STAS domain-containing protein n=1 Tax=Streptomyces sp. MMBL 11-3 TaxID=3382639 RepID=UPI0039B4EE18
MPFDPHALPHVDCVARSARDGSIWIIALHGDFDALTDAADNAVHTTADVLRSFGGPLVFDLTEVTFCDSSLLNLFIHTARQRTLALVGVSATIQRLIDVAGLSGYLKTYPDLEQARAALTSHDDSGPQPFGVS